MKSIAELAKTIAFESMESAGAEQARRADYNHEWALEVERELATERALADRLAECLSYHAEVDGEYAPDTTLAALAAWKEARNKI